MPMNHSYRKKLIEVALPLPEINDASAYDKMPGIGPHPKGIHQWWARLPLPTARAVLFASVVTDPSDDPAWKDKSEEEQNAERERLFDIIRRMMQKKLHEHPEIYAEAKAEMLKHCNGSLPPVFDPFAGGGSIPLEASRLGFEAHAGDLNPVAVLLNKCNLEIAPRWAGHPPINPESREKIGSKEGWKGTRGLAEDVRYYGRLIRKRAIDKIGHLYPKVTLPKEHGGGETNVIAWIWARTVASDNAAAKGKHVPLISTYRLSNKKDKLVWLEPIVDRGSGTYYFEVKTGIPKNPKAISMGTKARRGGFYCLLTGTPITFEHVRQEGQHGRLSTILLAIIAEGRRGKVCLSANKEHEEVAEIIPIGEYPDTDLPDQALGFRIQNYGIRKHYQMFTPRQLSSIMTFSDLIKEINKEIQNDLQSAGLNSETTQDYSAAVTTFLALALNRCASFNNSLCRWNGNQTVFIFSRAAIPMIWDFPEVNLLGEKAVCWHTAVKITADALETIQIQAGFKGTALQIDAAKESNGLKNVLVSTDPPYYDNIGYAALSDLFYIWLRHNLGGFYPDLFGTMLVPKIAELTASAERFEGDKVKAKEHFESGFRLALISLRKKIAPHYPLTLYYAFKQDDEKIDADGAIESDSVDLTTGWETLLTALISSGFQITATWPIRASFKWRVRALGSNTLASYIVLACRPRPTDALQCGRREFLNELKRNLPPALRHLQQGNVAPVDFAQAAIGPGMAIYSNYSRILEPNGEAMTVRTALGLINQILTEVLSEQEDEFDNDTRWALAWFEQKGFDEGDFGEAEVLSKAKVTSVSGMVQAGILSSRGGTVRLLGPNELSAKWDPEKDTRPTVWEMTHHLVRIYHVEQKGEKATAELLRKLGSAGEVARDLAYRLFAICEKKKLSQEAQGYNALVLAWPEIARLAQEIRPSKPVQPPLL
jgi:putative DNA methylase